MKKEIIWLGAGALLFAAALLIPWEIPAVCLYLLAFLVSGWEIITGAIKGILRGKIFNENTLMAVAAIGAFCIQEYPEAVFVVLFYRVGELFEDYAVEKSRKSIRQVMDICPEYANLLADGKIQKVAPETVRIGDIILVSPGEKVPLDGIVIAGRSFVDTSALTGEPVPRGVAEGDSILSGCINQNTALSIRITKSYEDSTVSRILELVETASSRKSSSEKFITKFAKYYTPAVLICAALLAVVPPLISESATFTDYLYRALSFLVVSCPCALVISVPLAFFGGIGGAAKKGILIKGGTYLEALSQAQSVVFDKTGTLTVGSFCVSKIEALGMTEAALLEITAHAEHLSSHPIAQSIRAAYGKEPALQRITDVRESPGHGIRAVVDGKTVLAGNEKWMRSAGITCRSASHGTTVYVAVDGKYAGNIQISDQVKPDAKAGILALKKSGIAKTVMLTGDRKHSAEQMAKQLGIDRVESELLPQDKVSRLEEIMSASKGRTVYVGDGINDAPVLARADVGIAMGALGSDAAIEAADIVIMTDQVTKIEAAVKIARKTMSIARQNIIFSLAVKIGILILCSLNVVGMGVAIFGDVGVLVLAVLNAFRTIKQ